MASDSSFFPLALVVDPAASSTSQAPKSHPVSTGQQCPSRASILLTNVNHVFNNAVVRVLPPRPPRWSIVQSSLTERYVTHPLGFLVIRYLPSSYVNAGHSLRSWLNDWAFCGNPFTTKPYHHLGHQIIL